MDNQQDFDAAAILASFGDELSDISMLVNLVLNSLPGYCQDLWQAFQANDRLKMAKAAHTIAGSVGNVHAIRLATLVRHLEASARRNDTITLDVIDEIERAATDLFNALSRWVKTLESSHAQPAARR